MMLGVILAGGASRRMGGLGDKALLEVAGRPMAAWVIDAISGAVDQILVAGRAELLGIRGMADPPGERRGPLAGLSVALAEGRPVLVVAVDQPWLRPITAQRLVRADADQAVVPVEEGVRQTTCAFYPPALSRLAASELAGGGSIQSLLDMSGFRPVLEEEWRGWGEDGRSWFSIDEPADIEEGLHRFGPPQA
jgi:molybdopterin-guanine dinucleotide biosynthesis protein A